MKTNSPIEWVPEPRWRWLARDVGTTLLILGAVLAVAVCIVTITAWVVGRDDPAPVQAPQCTPERIVTRGDTTWTYCVGSSEPVPDTTQAPEADATA